MFRRTVRFFDSRYARNANEMGPRPNVKFERGTWHYTRETTEGFQRWCEERQVRSYNNLKVAGTPEFCRCLRSRRLVLPGEAIITVPLSACFNFLVASKEMFDAQNTFPLPLSWMDYDLRLEYLPSVARWELALAGWMNRIHSLEDSPFTPYIKWLYEDSRGRDGAGTAINQEREQKASMLDNVLTDMVVDGCDEGDNFLENLFRGLACAGLRAVPIEPEAIVPFLPGTNFFKAKVRDMHVPTLMPLIDAVPQLEGEDYPNTLVQYFPFEGAAKLAQSCAEMSIPVEMDANLLEKCGGFFALRAMTRIEPGAHFYLRRFVSLKAADKDQFNMLHANQMLSRD